MNNSLKQLVVEAVQNPTLLVTNQRLQRALQALDELDAINSDNVENESTVTGNSVTEALDWLAAHSSGVTLQTNGAPNGSQTLLNLVAGSNITLTDDGVGGVTIDATYGGSGIAYGGAVTTGHDNEVLYIDSSGNLSSDLNFRRDASNNFSTIIDATDGNISSIVSLDITTCTIAYQNGGTQAYSRVILDPNQSIMDYSDNFTYEGYVRIGSNALTLQYDNLSTNISSISLNTSTINLQTAYGANTASLQVDSATPQITCSANTLQFIMDGNADSFSLFDTTAGIYFAGISSGGLGLPVAGLGIDIVNDTYTLGNPSSSSLNITGLAVTFDGVSNFAINTLGSTASVNLNTPSLTFTMDENLLSFNFIGSNLLSIGGKNIDYSAVNAAGIWAQPAGDGVIAYLQDTGWAASTVTTPVKGGLTDLSVLSDVLSWAQAVENALFAISGIHA